MPRILVIDEDRSVLQAVRQAFNKTGIQVVTARTASRGLALASGRRPDLVIQDLFQSSEEGWALLHRLRDQASHTPVIVVAPPDGNQTVIEAAKRGAFDFLFKPIDYVKLRELVRGALASPPVAQTDRAAPAVTTADTLIGSSAAMQQLYKEIARAALRDIAVLLIGETGAGKTLTAWTIHRHGQRRGGRFSTFDPSGMPVERLEYELFGYERGAFAGAQSRRIGWLERSDGGTLLFKQIDQLHPRVQGQLVRLFEQGRIQRIGGGPYIAPDVRIMAATRRELEPLVAAGRFRADLYYYLDNFTIRVPPLRERPGDLAELTEHFWRQRAENHCSQLPGLNSDVFDVLAEYRWPGNLWELQSVVWQMFWRARGQSPSPSALPEFLRLARTDTVVSPDSAPSGLASIDDVIATTFQNSGAGELYAACAAVFDRYICDRVLAHTDGNQSRAARILGITRRSLRTKTRRWTEGKKSTKTKRRAKRQA